MITALSISLVTLFALPPECDATGPDGLFYSDFATLYSQGKTYVEFRDAATRRVEAWHEHYANAQVTDVLRARVQAVPGNWKLLVIAEDWCGDSANTIPYIAKLVDIAGNLDMRIINSTAGREIMEAHRTPDGRTATPTVVLLTDDYQHSGCWVERPLKLETWFLANKEVLEEEELYDQKYAWYDEDQGRETVREIIELMEAATLGETICGT